MVTRRGAQSKGKAHHFGGKWTQEKLAIIKAYLAAYTTALKNKPFTLTYIDAFAGTGYQATGNEEDEQTSFLDANEVEGLLAGSARLALETDPTFDKFLFIDKSADRCTHLAGLAEEFPHKASRIAVERGDANEVLREVCSNANWSTNRAVLFLDPYGAQVDWTTIETVAGTGAIDMWLLFPHGSVVNRMLPRSGEVPDAWQRRLDRLLGSKDWRDAFFKPTASQTTLFGEEEPRVEKVSMEAIGRYFVRRLETIFPGVAQAPRVLVNSRGYPLFLLCFAVGSERGTAVALRIANHILKKV